MSNAIGTVTPDDPSHYAMQLNNDGTVTMHLYCNRARGTWRSIVDDDGSSGQFAFSLLSMTKMQCPPPSMDTRIMKDMEYVRSFLLKDGKLYLSLMADGGIYTWEPDTQSVDNTVTLSPSDGGPRYWKVRNGSKLDLHPSPSTASKVIATYDPGTLLNNLGCEHVETNSWCDVQKLGGGARGYANTAFLEPLTAMNGNIITGNDTSALRAGEGKFDTTGKITCSMNSEEKTQCEYGIAHDQGGDATMVIKKPDGRTRAIFFQLGEPMSVDTSQADGYLELKVSKENEAYIIDLEREYYEVPDTIILGK